MILFSGVSRPAGVLVEQGGNYIVVKMSLSETNALLRRGILGQPPFVGRGRRQAAKPLDAL